MSLAIGKFKVMQWVELCPPKTTCPRHNPVSANVTLFGNSLFADRIKDLDMRSAWI